MSKGNCTLGFRVPTTWNKKVRFQHVVVRCPHHMQRGQRGVKGQRGEKEAKGGEGSKEERMSHLVKLSLE